MITSMRDLTELARNHPQLAAVLADADWYLVGSRATAAGDDLSDWDTVVFTREDGGAEVPAGVLDEAFAVARPALSGPLDLGFHVRWRQAHAVELQILGPSGRSERERAQPAE